MPVAPHMQGLTDPLRQVQYCWLLLPSSLLHLVLMLYYFNMDCCRTALSVLRRLFVMHDCEGSTLIVHAQSQLRAGCLELSSCRQCSIDLSS
jgi:hypothetical protein